MKARIRASVALLVIHIFGATHATFKVEEQSSYGCVTDACINYEIDNTTVGFVSYTKVAGVVGVIHSLFIYPQFRNKGNATKLLDYTCNVLKEQGAYVMFIQPGPFDLTKQGFQNIAAGDERTIKLQKLVKLYTAVGFKPVHKCVAGCVRLAYYLGGLHEDARYLMFR